MLLYKLQANDPRQMFADVLNQSASISDMDTGKNGLNTGNYGCKEPKSCEGVTMFHFQFYDNSPLQNPEKSHIRKFWWHNEYVKKT